MAWLAIRNLRRRNAHAWLDLLENSGNVTPDELEEAFRSRPAAAELFAIALDAAAKTQQAERHRLLAGIVAAGLRDGDADVDVLLLLEQAAERLTDPHIRLLLLVDAHPQELIEGTPGGIAGVTDKHLQALWPEAANVIVPLRLALEREGLIRDLGAGTYDFVQRWVLDDFGQRLVNHYKALGGGL